MQAQLKSTNSALQRTRYLLKEKSGHMETTLSFLEMYLAECDQSF